MTEDDIRRIIREEIDRARDTPSYRGFPMPSYPSYPPQPNMPILPDNHPWQIVT